MDKNSNNEKKYREISPVEEDAREGLLFKSWKSDWGLKVSTWYGMDKIKFAFIEIGAGGKGRSFDVFMPTIKDDSVCFDNWAHDMLNDLGVQDIRAVLAAESKAGEKYPKYYKFITGDNGEKSIGICNSTKGGYCINGSITRATGKKKADGSPEYKTDFANIAISYYDLRRIAERYMATYEERRAELEELRIQGIKDSYKNHKEKSEDAPKQEEKPEKEAPKDEPKKPRTKVENTDEREEVYQMFSDGTKCFDLYLTSGTKEVKGKAGVHFCTARNEANTRKYNIMISAEAKERLKPEVWDIISKSHDKDGTDVQVSIAATEGEEGGHPVLNVIGFLQKESK